MCLVPSDHHGPADGEGRAAGMRPRGQADEGIVAHRRDRFQRHGSRPLNGPLVILPVNSPSIAAPFRVEGYPPCRTRTIAAAPAELVGVARPGRLRLGLALTS